MQRGCVHRRSLGGAGDERERGTGGGEEGEAGGGWGEEGGVGMVDAY